MQRRQTKQNKCILFSLHVHLNSTFPLVFIEDREEEQSFLLALYPDNVSVVACSDTCAKTPWAFHLREQVGSNTCCTFFHDKLDMKKWHGCSEVNWIQVKGKLPKKHLKKRRSWWRQIHGQSTTLKRVLRPLEKCLWKTAELALCLQSAEECSLLLLANILLDLPLGKNKAAVTCSQSDEQKLTSES